MNKRGVGIEPKSSGLRSLWAAVITQLLEDATTALSARDFKDGKVVGERAVNRFQARAWFNIRNPDFIESCNLAGLDPDAVITRALAIFRRCDKAEALGECFTLNPSKSKAHAPTAVTMIYEANGKRMTLAEWAEALDVPKATLTSRIKAARHPLEFILSKDFKRLPRSTFNKTSLGRKPSLHTVNGVTMGVSEWAAATGIQTSTLRLRLRKGFSMDQAIAQGRSRRGMGYDFEPSRGTGVGSTAQESAELEISESNPQ